MTSPAAAAAARRDASTAGADGKGTKQTKRGESNKHTMCDKGDKPTECSIACHQDTHDGSAVHRSGSACGGGEGSHA